MHVWLGRGLSRPILFLSKIGALIAGPLVLMAILPALLAGLCSLVVTPLLGIELSGQMGGFGEWTAKFFPRGISPSMHSLDRVMAGSTLGMLDKYNEILFSPGVAPLAALGFILVCLGVAGLIFQRQDLLG